MDVDQEGDENEEESNDVNEEKVEKSAKRRARNKEENKNILVELMKMGAKRRINSDKWWIDSEKELNVTSDNTPVVVSNNSFTNIGVTNPQPGSHEPSAVAVEQTTLGGPASANGTTQPADETAHPANTPLENTPLANESPIDETAPHIPTPFPSPHRNAETGACPSSTPKSGDDEVVKEDTTSGGSTLREIQNDEDLPPWLNPMIGYLRRLTEDVAWQNLVNNFIAFERLQPLNGVSPIFFSFLGSLL